MIFLAPDPAPGVKAAVSYVAYDFAAAAADSKTGKVIPGYRFKCHVPVVGRRTCKLLGSYHPAAP